MLNQRNRHMPFSASRTLLVAVLWLCVSWAGAQDAVAVLKAASVNAPDAVSSAPANEQAFEFTRNLIFFPAVIDGREGKFILDTGAPTLLLNSRGNVTGQPATTGLAAGGTVALTNQRVASFEMSGRSLGKRWALALDLRGMEARTGETIDGFVGHDLLRNGEVRINYPGRKFQLLKSVRNPRHEGRAPVRELKFEYVDHLPVITLRVGKRKLRFAIDTGAGVNLIDPAFVGLYQPTGEEMNIQGLDGANANHKVVRFSANPLTGTNRTDVTCVAMDLSHLQSPGESTIAGILGSDFLSDYVVGVDYRRRKIYLW